MGLLMRFIYHALLKLLPHRRAAQLVNIHDLARAEYGILERRKDLSLGVRYVVIEGVEGDIAEFGTLNGASAAIIALAMGQLDGYEAKQLHLFDSFSGFPRAESDVDLETPHVKSGLWREGRCSGSKEELMKRIAKSLPQGLIAIYDGWFKDTLSQIPPGTKFAMVHIDCDLYQSASEVLDHCFANGLVSEGAVIFFDDWYCNRARPDLGEQRAWAETLEKFSVNCSDYGNYSWAGKKFIVHSYHNAIQ